MCSCSTEYDSHIPLQNSAVFACFVKGEIIRQMRNYMNTEILEKAIFKFKQHLTKR